MSTPSTDAPATDPVAVPACLLCEKPLETADVVMVGKSTEDKNITVHPQCLGGERDKLIKQLIHVHVHVTPGERVSPAKQIVVKRRVKEIFKALAAASHKKRQQAQQQAGL